MMMPSHNTTEVPYCQTTDHHRHSMAPWPIVDACSIDGRMGENCRRECEMFAYFGSTSLKECFRLMGFFYEIGGSPSYHPFLDGIFPYKPSSYGGTPHDELETYVLLLKQAIFHGKLMDLPFLDLFRSENYHSPRPIHGIDCQEVPEWPALNRSQLGLADGGVQKRYPNSWLVSEWRMDEDWG